MAASVSLVVPKAMSLQYPKDDDDDKESKILILSRITAIILFILFTIYLYFQFNTHAFIFLNPLKYGSVRNEGRRNSNATNEERGPTLSPWVAGCVLITAMFCVIGCASYLVDSIDGLVEAVDISRTFIGLVLIPIAANAAICVTTVASSMKYRIDFTIIAIVSSVLQIALFVTPLLVLLGWILEIQMKLNFDMFEVVVFFLAIIVVNYIIQGGRTNYFEGLMLVGTCVNCLSNL
jgi:Ca2+:H+ antiporter